MENTPYYLVCSSCGNLLEPSKILIHPPDTNGNIRVVIQPCSGCLSDEYDRGAYNGHIWNDEDF